MNIKNLFGFLSRSYCDHDWSENCEKCSKCGYVSVGLNKSTNYPSLIHKSCPPHYYRNCTCLYCGKISHNWKGNHCATCGSAKQSQTKISQHDWSIDCTKCAKCGISSRYSHKWDGCICIICGSIRDENHEWFHNCDECSKCGKKRINQHDWSKDCEKCSICGKTRENTHQWGAECKCELCGKEQHDWSKDSERCSKCGKSDQFDSMQKKSLKLKIHDLKNEIDLFRNIVTPGLPTDRHRYLRSLGSIYLQIAIERTKVDTRERAVLEKLKESDFGIDCSKNIAEITIQLLKMSPDLTKRTKLEKNYEYLKDKADTFMAFSIFGYTFGLDSGGIKQLIKDKISKKATHEDYKMFEPEWYKLVEQWHNLEKEFEDFIVIKDIDSLELIYSRINFTNIESMCEALKEELKSSTLSEGIRKDLEERLRRSERELDSMIEILLESYFYELLNMMCIALEPKFYLNSKEIIFLLTEMIKVYATFLKYYVTFLK